jgi:hypothetical protein
MAQFTTNNAMFRARLGKAAVQAEIQCSHNAFYSIDSF